MTEHDHNVQREDLQDVHGASLDAGQHSPPCMEGLGVMAQRTAMQRDQCASAVDCFASDPAQANANGHLIAIFRAHIFFELLLHCRLEAFASRTVLIDSH